MSLSNTSACYLVHHANVLKSNTGIKLPGNSSICLLLTMDARKKFNGLVRSIIQFIKCTVGIIQFVKCTVGIIEFVKCDVTCTRPITIRTKFALQHKHAKGYMCTYPSVSLGDYKVKF